MQEKLMVMFMTINIFNSDLLNTNSDNNLKQIENELLKEKYQTSFFYLVEENENYKHYHVILAVKCLLETNTNFKINILNEIKEDLGWDVLISELYNFETIKQKFTYVLKDSYNNNLLKNNLQKTKFNYEKYFENHFEYFFKHFNNFIEINPMYNENLKDYGSIHNNKIKDITKESMLNIIKCYLMINNIKYKNNFLFKKNINTENSYVQYDSLKWIKNNYLEIYNFMFKNFTLNIKGVSLDDLFFKNKITNEDLDLILKNLPDNYNLQLSFDIIEFKNGFYFFKYNKFLEKNFLLKNNISVNKEILILKHYDYNYDRRKIPLNWKNSIMTAINNDKNKFETICGYFANTIIKNKEVFEKKKVLYIWGDSSTGKTTIIAKPLWKYFGEENVGIITGSKSFAFENLINKELAILDEYKYNKKRRETDLKLFEGQTIIEDSKYKEQQKIKELNVIVLSNFSINPEDYENNKDKIDKNSDTALSKRTCLIQFFKKEDMKNEIRKNIESEDPYILIYCNRVYHKKFIKNKAKTNNKNIFITLKKEKFLTTKTQKIQKEITKQLS